MEPKLVYEYDQILRILLNNKMGVNSTINKTGLPKSKGLEIISYLEAANIISRTKDTKHKQRDILVLTEFGKDLAFFGESLNTFEHSFDQLLQNIKTNFDDVEQKYGIRFHLSSVSFLTNSDNDKEKEIEEMRRLRNNHLLSLGWNKDETNYYGVWSVIGTKIKFELLDKVVEFINFRYKQFMLRYNLNPKAKALLSKKIENESIFYIQKKIDLYENYYSNTFYYEDEDRSNQLIESLQSEFTFNLIYALEDYIGTNFDNRFIIKNIRKIILDLMSVANIDKKYLKEKTESIIDGYEQIQLPGFKKDLEAKRPILEFYIDLANIS